VRAEVVGTVADLERLAPVWDSLCDEAGAPVLNRPFWCIPWARQLRQSRAEVVTVFDGADLVALVPLQVRSYGGVELTRFFAHGTGTVSTVVAPTGRADAAAVAWDTALRGHRRFAQLLGCRGAEPCDVPGLAGHPVEAGDRDACLVVDCTTPFPEYLAGRHKKLRENLRRADRALAARGGFEVEVVTTENRWLEVRSEVLGVFDAAEQAQPRQHFLRGPLSAFTDEMLSRAAADGVLRVFLGRVEGKPTSFGIVFWKAGTLSYWLTRFDPRWRGESVGVLLQRAVIADGFDLGAHRIDLMLGDGPHKRRWSTGSYATVGVQTASSHPMLTLGRTVLAASAAVRRRRTA
jgi:CelD/BcsL family acetyltransferase involved in cellulose biosynthesis